MKKIASALVLFSFIALVIFTVSSTASADEIKMVGVITKIDIAGKDAKTATVILKDNKTDELVTVVVNDDLTLDKFKDHRIQEGDEIRCKYEVKDGNKVSVLFKKTAGC